MTMCLAAAIGREGRDPGGRSRYYCQTPQTSSAACREALELLLPNMAWNYPEHFALDRDGAGWCWTDRFLDTATAFTRMTGFIAPLLAYLQGHARQETAVH